MAVGCKSAKENGRTQVLVSVYLGYLGKIKKIKWVVPALN